MARSTSFSLKRLHFVVFVIAIVCLCVAGQLRKIILRYNGISKLLDNRSHFVLSTEQTPTFVIDSNGKPLETDFGFFDKIGYGAQVMAIRIESRLLSKRELNYIEELGLRRLDLVGCTISPSAVESLKKLGNLEILMLNNCSFDKNISRSISELDDLYYLSITGGKNLPDDCITPLRRLSKLRFLILESNEMSDISVKPLSQIKSLRVLTLINAKLTDSGIEQLQRGLPTWRVSAI